MRVLANSASKAPKKAVTESTADGNKPGTKRKAPSMTENGMPRVIRRLSPRLTSMNLIQRSNVKNDSNLLNLSVLILASELFV